MNFNDRLNNLKNNNYSADGLQNHNIDSNTQDMPNNNENPNYTNYSQGQPLNNPNLHINEPMNRDRCSPPNEPINNNIYGNQNSQPIQPNINAHYGTDGYNSYNQQENYAPYKPNQHQQGQPYGQFPPQQPFNSSQGYGYEKPNFESRNIIKQMNQQKSMNSDASTKCLGKRFLAFIIDFILASIPSFLLALLFLIPSVKTVLDTTLYVGGNIIDTLNILSGKIIIMLIINIVIFIIYYIIVPAYILQGRTIGKKMMKLRIVTIEGEEIPDVTTLIKRELLGKFLSSLLLIGYFMILFSKNHSGLHDRIAKTKVIDDIEM